MFKKIDQLNTQLSVNADKNISQDTILKEIKVTQKSHETDLEQMKNMYKNQIELLSTLGVDEVYRISNNRENIEDIAEFRHIIQNTTIAFFEQYSGYIDMKVNDFVNKYKSELSLIFAKSIYDYEIYNVYEEIPNMILYKPAIKKASKDSSMLDYIMKTYFSKLFDYIESNEAMLFEKINTLSSIFNKKNNYDNYFTLYVLQTANIEMKNIDTKMKDILFVVLPIMFVKAYHFANQRYPYMKDIQNLIMMNLSDCDAVFAFYKAWKAFNGSASTFPNKVFFEILHNNSVFNKIYINKIKCLRCGRSSRCQG